METSIQEEVWAQISDTYALWSNPKPNATNCSLTKMPSLRFHNCQFISRKKIFGDKILYLDSGYYPYRYSYDSIFPLTISRNFEDWQMRFFSNISASNISSMVIRDFHGYTDLSAGKFGSWLEEHQIVRSYKSTPLEKELEHVKLTIHCVPQTTWLETIIADIPTICYWNPDDNLIREDLKIFFDELVKVGVVHYSPESAAVKVNEVSNDPSKWWYSKPVRAARKQFQNNVCYTSPDAIDQWSTFINSIKQ
jgi:putative transferase (TIGR04331 family)